MKDLRIEIANLARVIADKTDEYGKMYRDSRKRFLASGNVFNIVATDVSDYDGMEVTVCIGVSSTWAGAEKQLKAKAQDLTFEERAKAFDGMKAMREYGQQVAAAMKAELEAIKAEEEAEMAYKIRTIEKREYKHKKPGKRQHQLRQKRHYKLH